MLFLTVISYELTYQYCLIMTVTRSLSFIDGSEAKVSFRKSRELVAKQMM